MPMFWKGTPKKLKVRLKRKSLGDKLTYAYIKYNMLKSSLLHGTIQAYAC